MVLVNAGAIVLLWLLAAVADVHFAKARYFMAKIKSQPLSLQFSADADVDLIHAADNVSAIPWANFTLFNPLHRVDQELAEFFCFFHGGTSLVFGLKTLFPWPRDYRD